MNIFDPSLTASCSLPAKGLDGRSASNKPKKLMPNGECEHQMLKRMDARARQIDRDIDPIRQINLKTPVASTRQTFMSDVRVDQCRWPVAEFEGRTVCCGMPVVDRLAREGRREKTHCTGHLEYSCGSSLTASRSLPRKGADGRSAFEDIRSRGGES